MPIPENELRECLRAAGAFIEKRRPRPEIRHLLDFRADIEKSALVLSQVRPKYQDPTVIRNFPFAKVRWIGTRRQWRLYWMRGNLKWHAYEADRPLTDIAEILEEIDRDTHGCFFG